MFPGSFKAVAMKFSLGCLFLFFELGATCFRSSPGGGSSDVSVPSKKPPTITSSPPTTPACVGPPGHLGIFVAKSVNDESIRFIGTPTKNCTCSEGTTHYFATDTESDPQRAERAFQLKCPGTEACLCVSEEECYQPSAPGIRQSLYPFCKDGLCATYMIIQAVLPDNVEMVPTTGSKGARITYDSQRKIDDWENIMSLPGNYKKITAVGCGQCPKITC
uniref:Uncharacterized protein n=1 Tax=Steinernema glaseri TaxID=37863 RepID=A0A1I7Y8T0_9BILA